MTWLVNSIEFGGHLFQFSCMESWVDLTIDLTSDTGEDATTSDTGENAAFTSDMYNRRLLAFYVPTLPVWYLFLASLTASYMPSSVAQRVFVAFTISCKTRIFATGSAHHEHRTYKKACIYSKSLK